MGCGKDSFQGLMPRSHRYLNSLPTLNFTAADDPINEYMLSSAREKELQDKNIHNCETESNSTRSRRIIKKRREESGSGEGRLSQRASKPIAFSKKMVEAKQKLVLFWYYLFVYSILVVLNIKEIQMFFDFTSNL